MQINLPSLSYSITAVARQFWMSPHPLIIAHNLDHAHIHPGLVVPWNLPMESAHTCAKQLSGMTCKVNSICKDVLVNFILSNSHQDFATE